MSAHKSSARLEVFELALFLVESGIHHLVNAALADSASHHLPLQLISQGLERLLKVGVVVSASSNSPIGARSLRQFGHDIKALDEALFQVVETIDAQTFAIPYENLREDRHTKDVTEIITTFATSSRYADLDGSVAQTTSSSPTHVALIESFQSKLAKEFLPPETTVEPPPGFYAFVDAFIATVVDAYARCVVTLFRSGLLGDEGTELVRQVSTGVALAYMAGERTVPSLLDPVFLYVAPPRVWMDGSSYDWVHSARLFSARHLRFMARMVEPASRPLVEFRPLTGAMNELFGQPDLWEKGWEPPS